MPLVKGYSKASIAKNIAKSKSEGKPQKQAVAIALDTARAAKGQAKPASAAKRPGGK